MPYSTSFVQSNTQEGPVVKPSGQDLTGKEGYFASLNATGQAVLTAAGATPLFILGDVNADDGSGISTGSGADCTCIPLTPWRNFRAYCNGVIAAGASIGVDSTGAAVTYASGTHVGIAEEAGVVGQYILFRPLTNNS